MRKTEEYSVVFESDGYVEKRKRTPWAFVYEWLDAPMYAIILIMLIFTFLFRVVGVSGRSMTPTLNHGDWLTVSAVSGEVERGDIVVVTQPNAFNEPIIKRVIAKGGDTIDIDFDLHTVTVNGEILKEPYIAEPTAVREDFSGPITVPRGQLFVMGDNRNNSSDSRSQKVGLIDERYVLGVAQYRIFPFGDWKIDADEQ